MASFFYREQNQKWYAQIGKRQILLGADKAEAEKRFHAMMLDPSETDPTIGELAGQFLEWLALNRDEKTYNYYSRYVLEFVEATGKTFRVSKVKPIVLSRWADREYGKHSDSTRWAAYRSVIRLFNWSKKAGLIRFNPVEGVETPQPHRREEFITPEQYQALLAAIKDPRMHDAVVAMWETGCRPQEVRIVEARHYDKARAVWILDREQSKGKREKRIIYLRPEVVEITERLIKKHPTGPIFRNKLGKPWTGNAFRCRFRRIAEKLDFKCTSYLLRHGFGTRKLGEGVDSIIVAKLMGHSSTKMLEKVYYHATDAVLHAGLANGTSTAETSPA